MADGKIGGGVVGDGSELNPPRKPSELTFGEKMVGLDFNPSNNPKVDEVKGLYARIIDMMNELPLNINSADPRVGLVQDAIKQARIAKMCAVEAITYKD
jgi:hypothetical protein